MKKIVIFICILGFSKLSYMMEKNQRVHISDVIDAFADLLLNDEDKTSFKTPTFINAEQSKTVISNISQQRKTTQQIKKDRTKAAFTKFKAIINNSKMSTSSQDLEKIKFLIMKRGLNVNKTYEGTTPLIFATQCTKNPLIIQLLINFGANIHAHDDNQRTALLAAINKGVSYGIRSTLLDNNA